MELTDFSRIKHAVNIELLKRAHVVIIGVGGSYSLVESFARTGVGCLTICDPDRIEEVNIVRQGYQTHQIGNYKVQAMCDHLATINTGISCRGITENFLFWNEAQLDAVFGSADIILGMTDSFSAQARVNEIAIKYNKPAIWGGFYPFSRCCEIVFFIPKITGCYRCAVGSRYKAQKQIQQDVTQGGGYNTIFHSLLLDSLVGMLTMAILHNNTGSYEFSQWFDTSYDRSLLQFKVHPCHSNDAGNLFQRMFEPIAENTFTYNSLWRKVTRKPDCPDCASQK